MFRDPEMPYFFFFFHIYPKCHTLESLCTVEVGWHCLRVLKWGMFLEGLAFFKTVLCTLTFIIPLRKRKKEKKKRKLRQLEKKWLHSKSLFFFGSSPARVTFGNNTLLFLIRAWSKTNNASIFKKIITLSKKSLPCLSTGCLPLDIRCDFMSNPLQILICNQLY